MLIGLLSDTHIPDVAERLPRQIWDAFRGVDLILHAGDIYDTSVLDELESIAPVLAAMGDDDGSLVARDRRVSLKHTLNLDGLTLWLLHDRYSWWDAGPDEGMAAAYARPPDIIVCGHSHVATVQPNGGSLLVNPGSPTFPKYEPELGTVALLTINAGKADVRLVQLK